MLGIGILVGLVVALIIIAIMATFGVVGESKGKLNYGAGRYGGGDETLLIDGGKGKGEDYRMVALEFHNARRKEHQAEPLALDEELSEAATKCAEYYVGGGITRSCKWNDPVKRRENIFPIFYSNGEDYDDEGWQNMDWIGVGRSGKGGGGHGRIGKGGRGRSVYTDNAKLTLPEMSTEACKGWYDQYQEYDFNRPTNCKFSRDFVTMIWKGVTKMGIGIHKGEEVAVVVAIYTPAPIVDSYKQVRRNLSPKS